jgi:tRNA A-37 threonylcarbamoyl transferase component Bud32
LQPASAELSTPVAEQLRRALGPQFVVERLVGRGGFAEVYEVRDTELRRRLAVKVLRTDIDWSERMFTRFKQEARALAQLSHPHTVPVHFVGEGEGLVFYVMPFVEGITLADMLRADGPLDLNLAVGVAAPILDALEHAHRNGIVHRDIKPDNILIDGSSGRPLLVDFGISKLLTEEGTSDADVLGTPHYMAPEQALGEKSVDGRADVYAMGAVLYQMLTGEPPFPGGSSREIVARHLADPVVFQDVDGRIPDWMREVIVRALAKRPDERFASASAMLDALRQGLPSVAVPVITGAHALGPLSRDDPTVRLDAEEVQSLSRGTRSRGLVAALAMVAFGLAGAAGVSLMLPEPEPSLVVENGFLAPVAFSLNGEPPRQIAPGDSARIPLVRGTAGEARWWLLGPRSPDGELLGDTLAATIALPRAEGDLRQTLDIAATGSQYLMPQLTNATDDTLRVRLLDSSGVEVPCLCTVAPGAADLPLGYFRADRIRRLEVRDGKGRALAYENLIARSDRGSGALSLSLRPADFEPPTTLAQRSPAQLPDSQVVPLPDLRLDLPPLEPDTGIVDTMAPAPDSTSRRNRDPLAPIFRNR